MVEVSALTKSLDEGLKACRWMQCTFCGAQTPVVGVIGFCTWCENIVFRQTGDIERTDVWRGEVLARISTRLKERRYEDVMNAFNEMSAISNEAGLYYAMALALIEYSNYETSKIGYEKGGFMEENIVHRDGAKELYSVAKLRLNRAIKLAEVSAAQKVHQASDLYVIFLCQMKAGKLKAAAATLKRITALKEDYVSTYCSLLLAVGLKDYSKGLEVCHKLTVGQDFTINAFYYAAFCLLKTGKKHEANLILSKIRNFISIQNAALFRTAEAGSS
jgi:hypothetical protein